MSFTIISIPFAENAPQCIKDRLNDIIFHEMNKYLETVECMSMPCCLRLNARVQIQYSNNESDTHYYLSMVITDIPEIEAGTWIDKDIDISSETVGFQSEFISYCQYQVNKTLFPFQLEKGYKGNVKIYINQKKQLTCNTLDKWLGDGVCICKKGLIRLQKMGAISLQTVARKYYEIKVSVPEFEKQDVAFSVNQKNPLVDFYKYNGERKIESCAICGKEFIKVRNAITCGDICSQENRKRSNSKYSA